MEIKTLFQSLKKFENKHLNEDCFLICNGPSLNKMDLSPLHEYTVFGLNKIYMIRDTVDLHIDYHVSVNPYVVEQSYSEYSKMKCPCFLSISGIDKLHKDDINELSSNIYPIKTGNPEFCFSTNPYNSIHEGHTVTYVALQLIYWMGFKNVFIIGMDHTFDCKGNPNEKQIMTDDDPNHFHPEDFKGNEWQLPDLKHSERAYFLAHDYYLADKRNIYDATVEGKAYIFSKIDYTQALHTCNKKGAKGDNSTHNNTVTFEQRRSLNRLQVAQLNEKKVQECIKRNIIIEKRLKRHEDKDYDLNAYRLGFAILHPIKTLRKLL